ncbi:hypothetical protein BZA77DRAFT_344539 [Pyronema omphalodes]|nr:hypothetical protein BZA77DRAFT_344539 [Pyronema omphalodes]
MTETTPQHNHQQQQMDIDTNMDMDMDIDIDSTPPTPNNTTATTAVTSPATSSAETSPAIHPMHAPKASSNGQKDGGAEKKGLTPLERQRLLLKQKLAAQQPAGFSSPTDNMMTPISRKLADTKKKNLCHSKSYLSLDTLWTCWGSG